jgi:cytochrome c peroxidase
MQTGVVPTGSTTRVREIRGNLAMGTATPNNAQGATGFNIPALLGMVTGAPYFHAGNARTLEEVLDTTFRTHYQALSSNFLDTGVRADQVRQMVAFLLSIDDTTTAATVPTTAFNPDLCPTSLAP